MLATYRIIVSGKVQGVFFRQSTKEKAVELALTGTVRNLPGGEVEIIVTGNKDQLAALTAWCWQGPSKAVVKNVEVKELPIEHFERFTVLRSS